jgi:hypothetical protein
MKRTKRTKRHTFQPHHLIAPVSARAQACRQADEYGLSQTVYSVLDGGGCHWYHVSNSWWSESSAAASLQVIPLVTYLPNNYHPKE